MLTNHARFFFPIFLHSSVVGLCLVLSASFKTSLSFGFYDTVLSMVSWPLLRVGQASSHSPAYVLQPRIRCQQPSATGEERRLCSGGSKAGRLGWPPECGGAFQGLGQGKCRPASSRWTVGVPGQCPWLWELVFLITGCRNQSPVSYKT